MNRRVFLKRLGLSVAAAIFPFPALQERADFGDSSIAVGTIAPVAGDMKLPPGWLPCEGQELWKEDYPELFEVIGREYGGSIERLSFNLPDMRQFFLPFEPELHYIIKAV